MGMATNRALFAASDSVSPELGSTSLPHCCLEQYKCSNESETLFFCVGTFITINNNKDSGSALAEPWNSAADNSVHLFNVVSDMA